MQCPFCDGDSQVADSRTTGDGSVRRRRVCNACKRRFTTYEKVGSPNLKVLKRSGRSEPFKSDKLRTCLIRVCRRRPNISDQDIERITLAIEAQLVDASAKSVRAGQLADLALARLKAIDNLAHDRLAANYIDEDGQLRTDTPSDDDADQQLGLFRG